MGIMLLSILPIVSALEFDNVIFQPSASNTSYEITDTLESVGITSTHISLDNRNISFQSDASSLATITNVQDSSGYYQIFFTFDNTNTYLYDVDDSLYKNNVLVESSPVIINAFSDIMRYTQPSPNSVYFYDQTTALPLVNDNVIVSYPDGSKLILTTDVLGKVEFNSYYNDVLQLGEYIFNYTNNDGYNSLALNYTPSSLPFNVSYNITSTALNISLFFRVNGTTFTNDATIFIQGVLNETTDNGSVIVGDLTLSTGSYIVQVFSDDYYTEQKVIDFNDQSDLDMTFYLLETLDNDSNTLRINSIDLTQRKVAGAVISLLEYDPVTLSDIKVSECVTNEEGYCNFLVELNTKSYKWIGTRNIDGNEFVGESTTGEVFQAEFVEGDSVVFEQLARTLVLRFDNSFKNDVLNYLYYDIDENFYTATNESSISVAFYTTDGLDTTVCVEYFELDSGIKTSLVEYCATGSASTVLPATNFSLNMSKNYVADITATRTGSGISTLDSIYYMGETSFEGIFGANNLITPMKIFFWILILGICLLMKNVGLFGVLTIFFSWVEAGLYPGLFMIEGAVLKTIIALFIIYASRKKEDLQ